MTRNHTRIGTIGLALGTCLLIGAPAHAEPAGSKKTVESKTVETKAVDTKAGEGKEAKETKTAEAPSSIVILFDKGSSNIRPRDRAILDRVSRVYNEGKPIVMIVTGSSDRAGSPRANLALSQQRATAVLRGLLDRGIPAERFQVLAKGETDLPVPTKQGVAELQNRRVVISWH